MIKYITIFLLWGGSALFGIEFLAIPYANKKDPAQFGVFLKWFPKKAADRYDIYFFNPKKEKIAVQKSILKLEEIKKILGESYFKYKKELKSATDEDFLNKLYTHHPNISFFSIYDLKLDKILASRYIHLFKKKPLSKNVGYQLISYAKGKIMERSPVIRINWRDYPKINPPSNIRIKAVDKGAKITWDRSAKEGLIGYNIYISSDQKTYKKYNQKMIIIFKGVADQKKSKQKKIKEHGRYTIESLVNHNTYYLKMTTVHFSHAESDFSKEMSFIPRKEEIPLAPSIISIKQDRFPPFATIRWIRNTSGPEVAYYNVYRASKMDGPFTRINPVPIPSGINYYQDSKLLEYGHTYWYVLKAFGKGNENSPQSIAKYFSPVKKVLPPKVKIVKLISGMNHIKMHISTLDSKSILRYEVMRSIGLKGELKKIGEISLGNKEYVDKNLNPRLLYCYVVLSLDIYGNLSDKNVPKCARPENKDRLNPPYNVHSFADQGGILVEWEMQVNPFLGSFYLFRNSERNKKFKRIKILSSHFRRYIDLKVNFNMRYSYYVVSVTKGGLLSDISNITSGIIRSKPPLPVNDLKVYLTQKKHCLINWKYYSDDNTHFLVMARDLSTNREILLAKKRNFKRENRPKRFVWKKPLAGDYIIYVVVVNQYDQKSPIEKYIKIKI